MSVSEESLRTVLHGYHDRDATPPKAVETRLPAVPCRPRGGADDARAGRRRRRLRGTGAAVPGARVRQLPQAAGRPAGGRGPDARSVPAAVPLAAPLPAARPFRDLAVPRLAERRPQRDTLPPAPAGDAP